MSKAHFLAADADAVRGDLDRFAVLQEARLPLI